MCVDCLVFTGSMALLYKLFTLELDYSSRDEFMDYLQEMHDGMCFCTEDKCQGDLSRGSSFDEELEQEPIKELDPIETQLRAPPSCKEIIIPTSKVESVEIVRNEQVEMIVDTLANAIQKLKEGEEVDDSFVNGWMPASLLPFTCMASTSTKQDEVNQNQRSTKAPVDSEEKQTWKATTCIPCMPTSRTKPVEESNEKVIDNPSKNEDEVNEKWGPSSFIPCMAPKDALESRNESNEKQNHCNDITRERPGTPQKRETRKTFLGRGKKSSDNVSVNDDASSTCTEATSNVNKKSGFLGLFSFRSPKVKPTEKEEDKGFVKAAQETRETTNVDNSIFKTLSHANSKDESKTKEVRAPEACESNNGTAVDDNKVAVDSATQTWLSPFWGQRSEETQQQDNTPLPDTKSDQRDPKKDAAERADASNAGTVDEAVSFMDMFIPFLGKHAQETQQHDAAPLAGTPCAQSKQDVTENVTAQEIKSNNSVGAITSPKVEEKIITIPDDQQKINLDKAVTALKHYTNAWNTSVHGSTASRGLQVSKATNSFDYEPIQFKFSNASSYFDEDALIIPPVMRHRSITSC